MKYLMTTVFSVLALLATATAQQIPTLDFFHGRECPHCINEKAWFSDLKKAYPDIVINEYEVWHDIANQALWGQRLAEFDMQPTSVPTNIIGKNVVTGFAPEKIIEAMEANFGPPAVDLFNAEPAKGTKDSWWKRFKTWVTTWFSDAPAEEELTVVPPKGIHFHSNFDVYIDGQKLDLSGDEFMTEPAACYGVPGGSEENLGDFVHLHYNVGDVVHVHAEGITWRIFLETLGFSFTKNEAGSFVAFKGQEWSLRDLQLYSSKGGGVQLDHLIGKGQRIVVKVGSEIENLEAALEAVASNAAEFDNDETECH